MPAEPRRTSPRSAAGFLRRALQIMERHDGERYAELADRLRAVPVSCRVGSERFVVIVRGDGVRVERRSATRARLHLETAADAVVPLVDGRAAVEELLAAGRLGIRGDAEALLDFSSAIRTFARTAVACVPMQHVFEDYSRWVETTGRRPSHRRAGGPRTDPGPFGRRYLRRPEGLTRSVVARNIGRQCREVGGSSLVC